MQRMSKPEGLDLGFSKHNRSESISSDRPSLSGLSLLSPPVAVSPEPLYIATAAASHLVSTELDVDGVTVSQGALSLVNGFLDQILFSILARSRSTQLNQLRPAALEVLKARLGKEAVAGADEELKEYLGDGEDDEMVEFRGGQEPRGDFDLELAWKLARLRCMVYTRLGDLEEDDEDDYIEREGLDEGRAARRYSHPSSVTPASAIFLTSILEYLGEQALYYAGQATQRRFFTSKQSTNDFSSLPGLPDKPVVEEMDMFAVGRDSPLSRLWRTWRRNVMSPRASLSRTLSRESLMRRTLPSSRNGSISISGDAPHHLSVDEVLSHASQAASPTPTSPTQIPLPLSDNDVDEIEVPGLAQVIDEEAIDDDEEQEIIAPRPKSMFIAIPSAFTPPTPGSSDEESAIRHRTVSTRPELGHTRSRSLPTPVPSPFVSPMRDPSVESQFVTPMEMADPMAEAEAEGPVDQVVNEDEVDESNLPVEDTEPLPAPIPERHHDHKATGLATGLAAIGVAVTAGGVAAVASKYNGSREFISETEAEDSEPTDFLDLDDHEPEDELEAMKEEPVVMESRIKTVSVPEPVLTGQRDLNTNSNERLQTTSRRRDGVILNSPPSPRDAPVPAPSEHPSNNNNYTAPQPTKTTTVIMPPTSKFSPNNSGAPRLTPLREMMEDARDTSDEASSIAPSTDMQPPTRSVPNYSTSTLRGHSKSNSTSSNNSSKSKPSPLNTKAANGISTSQTYPKMDRGGSQSIPSSASTPTMNGSRSQRSDSASNQRPVTAQSHRSGKLHVVPSPTTQQFMPSHRSAADGKQSLENLIMSDETLHYTLTPQNVRELETADSPPRWNKKTPTADLADFLKNTSPPSDNSPRPLTGRSATSSKTAGLRSNPPDNMPPMPQNGRTRSDSKSKSFEIQTGSPKKNRLNVQPRDATIESSARTRDLADFAKATGPVHPAQLPAALATRPGKSSIDSSYSRPITSRADSGPGSPATRPSSQQTVTRSTSISRPRTGPRLQAREPVVAGDESSDLIDFIRQGPPRDPRDGHRIPRSVAPFRTTMDSDELAALGSPKMQDLSGSVITGRTSMASTQASSFVAKSMQSSVNSRTELLDSTTRANGRPVNGRQTNGSQPSPVDRSYGSTPDFEDGMVPKRKQRRVRDPYAIDSEDDEDEEEAEAAPLPTPKAKPRREEESLIDFLRNTSPPPETKFQPQPLMISEEQKAQAIKGVKRLPSNSTLKERLTRKTSIRNLTTSASATDMSSSYKRGNNYASPESPHLTQAGRYDNYRPAQPAYASVRERGPTRANGMGPRSGIGGTADLADFLRNTAPPEPIRPARVPSPIEEEKSGFGRFFSRRKKVAV